jgi:hypothetical protein
MKLFGKQLPLPGANDGERRERARPPRQPAPRATQRQFNLRSRLG